MRNGDTAKLAALLALVAVGVFLLAEGVAHLDLVLNPWLRTVEFRWVMLLTTRHAPTFLRLHHPLAFHISAGVIGGLTSLLILLGVWKDI